MLLMLNCHQCSSVIAMLSKLISHRYLFTVMLSMLINSYRAFIDMLSTLASHCYPLIVVLSMLARHCYSLNVQAIAMLYCPCYVISYYIVGVLVSLYSPLCLHIGDLTTPYHKHLRNWWFWPWCKSLKGSMTDILLLFDGYSWLVSILCSTYPYKLHHFMVYQHTIICAHRTFVCYL